MAVTPLTRRPTLVVLRALGFGDLLTAVPALRALADAFPRHRRVLATPARLAPLVDLVGAVDCVVPTDGMQRLDATLERCDVAVNLHGRGPQSHRLLQALRPHRLIAFATQAVPGTEGLPGWRQDEHDVARWCRLLVETGVPADPTRLDVARPRHAPPAIAKGATLIHPGAASGARRWPAARWASVAAVEQARGRRVVLTGGPDEIRLCTAIASAAGVPPDAVLAGRTDVLDLTATVAAAGRVMCGDTGIAHVATALGTPSIVLFGPSSPAQWGPPPRRPAHRVLWAGTEGNPDADDVDPGLLRIHVDDVLAELHELEAVPA